MEIQKKYFRQYLHEVAIEQLKEQYKNKGYNVSEKVQFGKYYADLVAEKVDDKIVIEVKTKGMSKDRREKIGYIADEVNLKGGYKFIVVIATPPREKSIKILNIEDVLLNQIVEHLPNELSSIAYKVSPQEVCDVEVSDIQIKGDQINANGSGIVLAELQYGSGSDSTKGDGITINDNYPFTFELILKLNIDKELEVSEIVNLEIDTSSFYE